MFEAEISSFPSFATVAVPIPIGPQGVLTYRIPEALRSRLLPGMRVLVPIGRRKTTGIVTSTRALSDLPDPEKAKDILDTLDEEPVFPPDLMRLWQWASGYYFTSPGEMLSTILPGGLRDESTQVVKLKKSRVQSPESRTGSEEIRGTPQSLNLTAAEQEILALVAEKKRVTTKTLRRHFPALSLGKALQKLDALGLLQVSEHLPQRKNAPSLRTAAGSAPLAGEEQLAFSLSAAQEDAHAQIVAALQAPTFQVFLLHGVTGSGKTAVYLQAAQAAVDHGSSVLILVPEIALTHQLIAHVRRRFGAQVAVLHSARVASERWAEWRRIRSEERRVGRE